MNYEGPRFVLATRRINAQVSSFEKSRWRNPRRAIQLQSITATRRDAVKTVLQEGSVKSPKDRNSWIGELRGVRPSDGGNWLDWVSA